MRNQERQRESERVCVYACLHRLLHFQCLHDRLRVLILVCFFRRVTRHQCRWTHSVFVLKIVLDLEKLIAFLWIIVTLVCQCSQYCSVRVHTFETLYYPLEKFLLHFINVVTEYVGWPKLCACEVYNTEFDQHCIASD